MNNVKYYAELTLAPLLFVAYLLINIKTAVVEAAEDTMSAVSDTRYKYGRR